MYYHLTQEQRIQLSLLTHLGWIQRNSASVLGVSPSAICRELKRNTPPSGRYHARIARFRTQARRRAANQRLRKLLGNSELETLVTTRLQLHWSPEQIAGRPQGGGLCPPCLCPNYLRLAVPIPKCQPQLFSTSIL
jgi:IS30 family transposase